MKKTSIKKILTAVLTSSVLLGILPVAANAETITGWCYNHGTHAWYYYDKDGVMLKNTTIEGYKLGADGAMIKEGSSSSEDESGDIDSKKGKWVMNNDKWYFRSDTDGSYIKGWISSNNHWFYCDEDGAMVHSTTKVINGKEFRFADNGEYIKN